MLTEATRGPEVEFHRELADVFASVRDLHTNYLLPAPFGARTAFLPFLVERYFDPPGRWRRALHRHQGGRVAGGTRRSCPRSRCCTGTAPVRRAVEANARLQAGSNAAASFARGSDALTIRPLVRSLPPDEDWVVVTYRGLDGAEREIRLDWRVAVADGPPADRHGASRAARARPGARRSRDGRERGEEAAVRPRRGARPRPTSPTPSVAVPVAVADEIRATQHADGAPGPVGDDAVGRLRPHPHLHLLASTTPTEFVAEFVRLAEALPQDGLMVDVRGNGGGLIYACERLLQVLTPRRVTPEPAQMTDDRR